MTTATAIITTIIMDINTNTAFTISNKCNDCFLKTYQRLFDKLSLSDNRRVEFMNFFNQTLKENRYLSAPEIQRKLSRMLTKLTGIDDLFAEEKKQSNSIALTLYPKWKKRVAESQNPFDLAMRLSIAGNIMDYGTNHDFDLHTTIHKALNAKLAVDQSKELQNRIGKAKQILYLGDNAGEIVFDKLFIETINHPNTYFAVRGGNALNDITIHDALEVGMNSVATIISNGYDAPSTILSKCSQEFKEIYDSSDLIISKGQGNLEGLLGVNDNRIFFLLMIKCDVIANLLNMANGSFIVYNPTQIN